jgi:hypothetical protein
MLDLFKKEPEAGTNIFQKEAVPAPPEQKISEEENLLSMFEHLSEEEKTLINEKTALLQVKEKMRIQIEEQIEAKRRAIENLKTQIPEIKQKCETLAKALEIPVYK